MIDLLVFLELFRTHELFVDAEATNELAFGQNLLKIEVRPHVVVLF